MGDVWAAWTDPLMLGFLALFVLGCNDYQVNLKNEPGRGGETDSPPGCEDWSAPDPGITVVDGACMREPGVGTFNPEVEWQWTSNPTYPGYDDIMAAPAIGNLNDDNGDGVVNADDIPDIVFTSFYGGAYSSAGTLTAISGDGSGTHWSVLEPGGNPIFGAGGVAIGDIDGDGLTEVCAAGSSVAVVCVNGVDGSLKWAAGSEPHTYGCPAMADLEGDGQAEVIFGRQVFESDGTIRFIGAEGFGGSQRMSFAVDWNGDGLLEIVAGRTIYTLDGAVLWSDPSYDDAPAVGDFDGDGAPDLVRAGSGTVRLNANDGTLLWEVSIPGGGNGGPPTVADFDGDGEPEVGVAALAYYTVFDTDGTVMWSNGTSDYSSSQTGSSVFDFEGDGAAEVVYSDEINLWIYDGTTGAVRLQMDGHASGTLMEYPLIADVDNDDSTEIIVASNNYTFDGWNGITVIGDADGSWAPARPIWNQYAYHITNVENDGSIPTTQVENWQTWNNFRAGGTELGPSHWQPNLLFGEPSVCTETCWENVVEVYLTIRNEGLLDARDFDVDLGIAQVITTTLVPRLRSGGTRTLDPISVTEVEWGSSNLFGRIDPDNRVAECDENDNLVNLGPWPCDAR